MYRIKQEGGTQLKEGVSATPVILAPSCGSACVSGSMNLSQLIIYLRTCFIIRSKYSTFSYTHHPQWTMKSDGCTLKFKRSPIKVTLEKVHLYTVFIPSFTVILLQWTFT